MCQTSSANSWQNMFISPDIDSNGHGALPFGSHMNIPSVCALVCSQCTCCGIRIASCKLFSEITVQQQSLARCSSIRTGIAERIIIWLDHIVACLAMPKMSFFSIPLLSGAALRKLAMSRWSRRLRTWLCLPLYSGFFTAVHWKRTNCFLQQRL